MVALPPTHRNQRKDGNHARNANVTTALRLDLPSTECEATIGHSVLGNQRWWLYLQRTGTNERTVTTRGTQTSLRR